MPRISFLVFPACLVLAASQWLIFQYAPEEQVMGIVQKIFYIHLPLAWWGLVSFGLSCFAGIVFLKKRTPKSDLLSAAAVEIGMLFCTLTLISGSIWGRHSWGVWWTWDPRLTTALILWFIYAAYLALRAIPMEAQRKAPLCAVISIVGFLDVPLVFFSARMWRSIHPAVFAAKGGGLEPEMLVTLLVCLLGFGLLWLFLLLFRWRQMLLSASLDRLFMEKMLSYND